MLTMPVRIKSLRGVTSQMKPAFAWPGGKSWAVKHIVPRITPHTCYCEPFAGGLAILLAKEPSKIEVINDINSDLVNFYRCVRFHLDELIKEIQWVLSSRQEFTEMKKQPGLTDIQRAARWFRTISMSFGADGDSYGVQRKSGGAVNKSRHSLMEKIDALNSRLDRVNVEHLDWERCIGLYDSKDTFFFVDPPYLGGKIKNYAAWSADDLRKLEGVLKDVKAKWILTMNDHPVTRGIFSQFKIISLKRHRGIANRLGVATEYKEMIIMPERGETARRARS